jgi:hypothetical protein
MGVADESIDLALVLVKERKDVAFVDKYTALLLARNDEIQVHAKSHPAIEWDPAENEIELGFDHEEKTQSCPVHEPWCQDGGIRCAQSFVREEHREEDRSDRATDRVSSWACFIERVEINKPTTYVRISAMNPNMIATRPRRQFEGVKQDPLDAK